MSKLRQSIANRIKFLRQNFGFYLEMSYPSANLEWRSELRPCNELQRYRDCTESIICSNLQDYARFSIHQYNVSAKELKDWLSTLPEDAYILGESYRDDDNGSEEILLSAYRYNSESDLDYSNRLTEYVTSTELYMYRKEFPKKRSGDADLDKYIEYLEQRSK
jgi:hypothetical protein